MRFQEKLERLAVKNSSLLCIGLDSSLTSLPQHLQSKSQPQFEFNKAIIDKTYDLVGSYKLNSAFYEAQGKEGIEQLKLTCEYLRNKFPEIPLILDAKRADIGNTNKGYTQFIFDYLGFDAVTLHPYLGKEALQPFLDFKEKGLIILCKTSNPGSAEFQDLLVDDKGTKLYQHIAEKVVNKWNNNGNCLLVVGATYPEEMKEIRKIAGEMTFLVPGIGVQGGDIEQTVRAGLNSQKMGLIIHSARGIIFVSTDQDYADKAREEAIKLRDNINRFR